MTESNDVHDGQCSSLLLWAPKYMAAIQQGKLLQELEWKITYFQELYDLCSFQLTSPPHIWLLASCQEAVSQIWLLWSCLVLLFILFFLFFFFKLKGSKLKKKKKSTKLSVEAFPKSLFRVSYRICWLFALTENKKSKIENLCQVIFILNLYPFITTPCVYIQRIPALTLWCTA